MKVIIGTERTPWPPFVIPLNSISRAMTRKYWVQNWNIYPRDFLEQLFVADESTAPSSSILSGEDL